MLPCLCSRKSLSSISSMPCQSSTSLVFLDLAINSFLSRTILVFNSVPLRLPFPSSQSSPPCTRLDIFNVFSTISSIHSNPFLRLTSVFPTFSSAISSIFINSPSSMYSRIPSLLLLIHSQLGFQLPPTLPCSYPRQSSSIVIVVVVSDGAGTAPGGGGPRGAYKCTCRGKPSMCTKRNTAGGGLQRMHEEG